MVTRITLVNDIKFPKHSKYNGHRTKMWGSWKFAKNRMCGHSAPLHCKEDGEGSQEESKQFHNYTDYQFFS